MKNGKILTDAWFVRDAAWNAYDLAWKNRLKAEAALWQAELEFRETRSAYETALRAYMKLVADEGNDTYGVLTPL